MEDNIIDSNNLTISRTKTDGNQKYSLFDRKKKNFVLLHNYYNNLYRLENQALVTGFGKMINAKNQTNPKYSFGKEKRFFTSDKKDDLPYLHKLLEDERYGNVNIGYHSHKKNGSPLKDNKINNSFTSIRNTISTRGGLNTINFVSGANCATDYYYCPPETNVYKHPRLPKFSFGKAKRDTEKKIKTYDYYRYSYDKNTDRENIDKKWSTRIIGGDIGVEDRFPDDRKLYYDSLSPGPGRYNPNYNYFKYKQGNYGYMGIKTRDDRIKVSTEGPKKISLTPYNIQYLIGTNQTSKKMNKSYKDLVNMGTLGNIDNNDFKHKNIRNNMKIFLRDKIEAQKQSKTNISTTSKED